MLFRSSAGRMQTLRGLERFKDYDGGVDVKYGLSSSLTLDATYRSKEGSEYGIQFEPGTKRVQLTFRKEF